MEACHRCEFASLPRIADVTLADFWECPPKYYDKRGVSLLLASNSQGLEALGRLSQSGTIETKAIDFVSVSSREQLNGQRYPIPEKRRAFLDGITHGIPFEKLTAKYFPSRFEKWIVAFRKSDSKTNFLTLAVSRIAKRILLKFTR
jgi:Coenzyme F420 hydrogenase/dehydrogenase, beta subunit C terminus